MIVDTSAVLAIVFREPGHESLIDRLAGADSIAMGTPTLAETGIGLRSRLGAAADGILERLLDEFGIEEIPFGELHWREAVDAFRRYGGGQHAAGLDFGDCLTHATASLSGRLGDVIRDEFNVEHQALTAQEAQCLIALRNADELRNRAASAHEKELVAYLQKAFRHLRPKK
jgi:ribonuclease VapC